MHDLSIEDTRCTIVDVPTVRRHKLSNTSVSAQSYVIVEMRLRSGVVGIGEAATLGGPRWSEESVEGIKSTIDAYLAPALRGLRADLFVSGAIAMHAAAKRNNAAKAALQTAMIDAAGKTFGLQAASLLGGAVRTRFPVLWTLASGDPMQEIDEAEAKLAARLHNVFKIKIGAQAPADDLLRVAAIAKAVGERATLIVDVNQAWDETVARRFMPRLGDLGVALVEQPLPAWNVAGLARLRTSTGVPILADECVFSAHDMIAVAEAAAADAVSLKLVKHGGPREIMEVAAIASAAGIALYGGCLLESSIGAAAHLHAFACLPTLAWGCEHFGPQILTSDLVTEPLRYEDFHVHLPEGVGLGLSLDPDKIARFARR